MTALPIVAQWINMEHYFDRRQRSLRQWQQGLSQHRRAGRVMSGASSDLRLGLPAQTVLDGPSLSRTDAAPRGDRGPRERVEAVIATHPSLERLFHNEWVSLVVCEPNEATFIIMTSCRAGNRWR